MKNWIEIFVVVFVFISLSAYAIIPNIIQNRDIIPSDTITSHIQIIEADTLVEPIIDNLEEYHTAKAILIDEVDAYIHKIAPKSKLNGNVIVEGCEKYNIDIIFVLAQGQQESHFGTAGVAAKTNSVFNVLAYDGRSAHDMNKRGHGFSHPNHSVEPYLELLTSRYLIDNKTEKDLMRKYVDKNGHRYASSKTYEQTLRRLYNKIDSTTDITEKYNQFRKYKILAEL